MCCEAWSNQNTNADDKWYVCTHCKNGEGTQRKFSAENNIDPGWVPQKLSDLTQWEEMLIVTAFPVMHLYVRKRHNTISYKEHALKLHQNVQNVANILPQYPENPPVIVFVV